MPLAAPSPDEFAPASAGYVARAAGVTAPLDELVAQRARLLNLLSPLTDAEASQRYAPDKWSVKQLVGHLADAERVFAYRLMRIGRGDTTELPGFDENDYARAAESDRHVFGDLLDDWAAVRAATITLARGIPEAAWTNRGTANNTGVSARALLYIILGHVEHHRSILAERYGVR
jgi:hypothetical protein